MKSQSLINWAGPICVIAGVVQLMLLHKFFLGVTLIVVGLMLILIFALKRRK